jgi:hypothetical protein
MFVLDNTTGPAISVLRQPVSVRRRQRLAAS